LADRLLTSTCGVSVALIAFQRLVPTIEVMTPDSGVAEQDGVIMLNGVRKKLASAVTDSAAKISEKLSGESSSDQNGGPSGVDTKGVRQLYIDQRYEWTVRTRFEITDAEGRDVYTVKGSLGRIPRRFYIVDTHGNNVADVTEKLISAMPTFYIRIDGTEVARIRKDFHLLKAKFRIAGPGLSVQGNILGSNFQILKNDKMIGQFNKNLLGWGDHYVIEILDQAYELAVVSMVLVIDYLNRDSDRGIRPR